MPHNVVAFFLNMFNILINRICVDETNLFEINSLFIEDSQESEHSLILYIPIKGLYYMEQVKYIKWVKFIILDNGNVTHIAQ